MARAGASYPQVEPGTAALMDTRISAAPLRQSVGRALDLCRATGARALVLGRGRLVREVDLARAAGWSLHAVPAAALAWRDLPSVDVAASEIDVRRIFLAGAPIVLVRAGPRVVGSIDGESTGLARPALSVGARLEHPESRQGEARLWLLRLAGKVGEGMGAAVFAVGGFVRDLLLGRSAPDVDLVVAGDGVVFARRLAEEVGGSLSVHTAFGTASIEGGAAGGAPLGRVDVASARRERYEAPGALPAVSPAGILEDLGRRDFSVNAMAVALAPSAFGRLSDPFGGQRDLRQRLLRPLHPLSFVEDPTRIFRAARYGARLGMSLGVSGRAALGLALRVGDFPALSGHRLRVEIDLLAAEATARLAFERLLAWRAFKIWHGEYRASERSRRHIRSAERFRGWARKTGIAVDGGDLALVALLGDQRRRVVGGCLERLAVSGEPRAILEAAVAVRPLVRRLDRARRPSEVAEVLRPSPVTVLAGAWLKATRRARRRVEWFLSEGRAARPLLSGDEVVALGVPRGPAVGECLAALRRFRLDGMAASIARERAYVRRWLRDSGRNDPHLRRNDSHLKGGVR